MQGIRRVVTSLPLSELWDKKAPIVAARQRHLSCEDLRQLVRAGQVKFVVANVGTPLRWIPAGETHSFWKLEVRPHLVDEPDRPFDIDGFPEGYCYTASEWLSPGEDLATVVLELHH